MRQGMEKQKKEISILRKKERTTDFNIYRIEGRERTAIFDGAQVDDDFLKKADILLLNRCSPDRMEAVLKILRLNPEIVVMGNAAVLNFTQEFLGFPIKKKAVRNGMKLDLGGITLQFIMVPNINRSIHQNRSWRKAYRFLQMPNWQWIDTVFAYIPEKKMLFSGQTFSEKEGSRKKCFQEHLVYFLPRVEKTLEALEALDIETICSERGESLAFCRGKGEYDKWIGARKNNGEKKLIVIPYTSAYGYTHKMAEQIAAGIEQNSVAKAELLPVKGEPTQDVVDRLYQADGIIFGVPTREEDCAKEMKLLAARLSPLCCKGKFGAAFGSFSYQPKGVPNMITRMKQLNMQVVEKGFSVRFKPENEDLKKSEAFGLYFANCVVNGEILPFTEAQKRTEFTVCTTKRKFVIIGNGAAGTTAAEELRKQDATCSIEMISEENLQGYNRQMLTKGILGEIPRRNMLLHTPEWYQDNHIRVLLDTRADRIDTGAKKVYLSDGAVREYDSLIIATGARPSIPKAVQGQTSGIFSLHTLQEVNVMREYIRQNQVESVLILGGGILGLETAAELYGKFRNITIAEQKDFLMENHLDWRAGRMLEESLRQKGIRIHTAAEVSEVLKGHQIEGVVLSNGEVVNAQLILLCTGIRENGELLGKEQQAIVVNDRMETGFPDVYACGDCAVFQGVNYGLWTQAVEMAKVAAANAAGQNVHYNPIISAVTYAGMGLSFFAIGDNGKDKERVYQSKELYLPGESVYKKFYFKDGVFCGGVLFGNVDDAKELIEAYKQRWPMDSMRL